MITLEIKLFMLKDKICAWEFNDTETHLFSSGGARPFKKIASMDKLLASDFYELPYTKKQFKTFEYIYSFAPQFEEAFDAADQIQPYEEYTGVLRQTFGPNSKICQLYEQKALSPKFSNKNASLFIDFEAMNMRICGWYAQLVDGDNTTEYEGIAKPFSDDKRIRRLWKSAYSELLPYEVDDICDARHIHSFKGYFLDMFRRAKRIYTYGDTDALFVKTSFGEDAFNFFKVKNVDVCVRLGTRALSLDKTCRLFGIETEGEAHDPKNDVRKMRAYIEKSSEL